MSNTDSFLTVARGPQRVQYWVSRRRVANFIVAQIIRGEITDRSAANVNAILTRYCLPRAYAAQVSGMIRRIQSLRNPLERFDGRITPARERDMRRDELNHAHRELRPRPNSPITPPREVTPPRAAIAAGEEPRVATPDANEPPQNVDREPLTPSPPPRTPGRESRTPSPAESSSDAWRNNNNISQRRASRLQQRVQLF